MQYCTPGGAGGALLPLACHGLYSVSPYTHIYSIHLLLPAFLPSSASLCAVEVEPAHIPAYMCLPVCAL